mmetsp:Transcript_143152/g.398931  ORF Transcript_143152/g.398931 Transcript_143152/m.398931 type:complete len:203 (-) Transcript_143152:465-1073(-)
MPNSHPRGGACAYSPTAPCCAHLPEPLGLPQLPPSTVPRFIRGYGASSSAPAPESGAAVSAGGSAAAEDAAKGSAAPALVAASSKSAAASASRSPRRSAARASINAQPRMFAPFHCTGSCARGSPLSMPMPQILSFLVASAISLSPVPTSTPRSRGDCRNFWNTTWKATEHTIRFHTSWSKFCTFRPIALACPGFRAARIAR